MDIKLRRISIVLTVCLMSLIATGRPITGAEPQRDSSLLVEPAQLEEKLNDPRLRILDVRSASEYRKGHIPGAVPVDVSDWKALATAAGGLHDAEGWSRRIAPLGIASDSHVVVYGSRLPNTSRVWWLLKYVGLKNVSLMNGSWQTWVDAGLPVETMIVEPAETEFKPQFQQDRLEEMESLKDSLGSDAVTVVDTRSDSEFGAGRIPGSVHLDWAELVAEDGRFKTKAQLQSLFRERGIVPTETAVCY